MSVERPVRYVELSALVHATEDKQKVLRAICNLFPKGSEPSGVQETKLTGVFGDPIFSLKLEISKRRPGTDLLDHLIRSLSFLEYTGLLDDLPQRMDESKNLYLRFDKQKAYQGKTALETHDAIRVKFRLQVPHGSDPLAIMTKYIEDHKKDEK